MASLAGTEALVGTVAVHHSAAAAAEGMAAGTVYRLYHQTRLNLGTAMAAVHLMQQQVRANCC